MTVLSARFLDSFIILLIKSQFACVFTDVSGSIDLLVRGNVSTELPVVAGKSCTFP